MNFLKIYIIFFLNFYFCNLFIEFFFIGKLKNERKKILFVLKVSYLNFDFGLNCSRIEIVFLLDVYKYL